MRPDYEAFLASYVDAYNRSLGDTVDTDGIRAHFADCFVGSGPAGANCGQDGDTFADALRQGYAFSKAIGTKRMSVRGLTVTEIEPGHALVRVDYHAGYEKDGQPLGIDFDMSYRCKRWRARRPLRLHYRGRDGTLPRPRPGAQ